MDSPDPADETLDAGSVDGGPRVRLPVDPVALPVFRPRRRARIVFWTACLIAAVVTATVVWLLLR